MNEQLFASLKTKFEGVQDAILRRVAEKYGRDLSETASEDEITGVVENVTFQNVLESYGDSRANEAANTAVSNYKKKNSNTKKTGQEQQNQTTKVPDDAPDWAKSLISQNQELQKKIEGLESKERTKSFVQTAREKLIKDKKVPESFFKNRPIEVKDESEIDTVVEQISGDYSAFRKDLVNQGLLSEEPKESLGGNSGSSVDKDIEEWA